MNLAILSHPLDEHFSDLLRLGLTTKGISGVNILGCQFTSYHADQELNALIVMMRPELLKSHHIMSCIKSADDRCIPIIPIIIAPIMLTDWPSGITNITEAIDFTDHSHRNFNQRLSDLENVLKGLFPLEIWETPPVGELHILNLLITQRIISSKINQLDSANFNMHTPTPSQVLTSSIKYQICTTHNNIRLKTLSLAEVLRKYSLITLNPLQLDYHIAIECVISEIIELYITDPNTRPVPVLINLDTLPREKSLIDQLDEVLSFVPDSTLAITMGKIQPIIYTADKHDSKCQEFIDQLERRIDTTNTSIHLVLIKRGELPKSEILQRGLIVKPELLTVTGEVFEQFRERPLSRIWNSKSKTPDKFLMTQPLYCIHLLSIKPNSTKASLSLTDCYEMLINAHWLLGKSINNDNESSLPKTLIAFSKLAALMTNSGSAYISRQHALRIIESEFSLQTAIDGGLVKEIDGYLCFGSTYLQVYFSAIALLNFGLPARLPKLVLNEQRERIQQNWDDAIILLAHLSPNSNHLIDLLQEIDPLLALECITMQIPSVSSRLSQLVEKNLELMRTIGDFRTALGNRLYAVNENIGKSVLVESMRTGNWDTRCAATNVLLHRFPNLSPEIFLEMLKSDESDNENVVEAINRIGVDAFILLIHLLQDTDQNVRRKSAILLGKLQDKAASPALVRRLEDVKREVVLSAIYSLTLLNDFSIIVPLTRATQSASKNFKKIIGRLLLAMFSKNSEKFTNNVYDADVTSRHIIVSLISELSQSEFTGFLLQFSHDSHPDVRIAAIKGFKSLSDTRLKSRLEECISDTEMSTMHKYTVGEIASRLLSVTQKWGRHEEKDFALDPRKSSEIVKARLLNAKEDPKSAVSSSHNQGNEGHNKITTPSEDTTLAKLLIQVRQQNWDTSNEAAKNLREYAKQLRGNTSPAALNQVVEILNDQDWVIRWVAVETLGWIGNVYVVPHLIQRLSDPNWKVKIAAVRALVEIKDTSAIEAISELITDTNAVVRETAAEALGGFQSHKAISALKKAIADTEDFVRLAAVESLGKINHKLANDLLISSLKDKNEHVRWAAANALIGVQDTTVVPALLPSLMDNGGPYWEQKRICDIIAELLEKLQSDEAHAALTKWRNIQSHSSG